MAKKQYALDPRNARIRDAKAKETLRKSLEAFGVGRSIVIDKNDVVISGNGVYEQAQELGIKVREIETDGEELIVVKRTDLETADPRRIGLALADNQTATLAKWDEVKLEELKTEVLDFVELGAMGFDEPPAPDDSAEVGEMIDRAEELNEKWQVERGQIFEVPSKSVPGKFHRIMCGDSTDAGDVALLLAGAEPYLMVTDPPYGVKYDPNWRNEAAAAGKLAYAASRIGEVTNDDRMDWGEVYSLWPCSVLYAWSPGGDHIIITGQSIIDAGFQIRNQIIWSKSNFPISRGAYTYRHEPCWYAVRKGKKAQWIGLKNECTVWPINLDVNVEGGHSTQKPVECMARPIRNHEGNVADPFLGSGTTVVAAEQEGRVAFGMEITEKYVAVTLERLTALGLRPVRCAP